MKTTAFAILAALLALTGCAGKPGTSYNVRVEAAATPQEVEGVLAATDMWVAKIPAHFSPQIGEGCHADDGIICIHFVQTLSGLVGLEGGPHDSTWATTHLPQGPWGLKDGGDVYIDAAKVPADKLAQTIAHEIGHAMGLMHLPVGNLMCANTDCQAAHPTNNDAAQWYDVRR